MSSDEEDEHELEVFGIIVSTLVLLLVPVIVVGNAMVLTLYGFDRQLRVATNFFISMLCVADLFVGVSLSVGVGVWLTPSLMHDTLACLFVFALMTLFIASSLHFQTSIACDRWLAISRPLRYASIATMQRVVVVSIGIWVFCIGVFLLLPVLWRNDPDQCHYWLVFKEEFLLYVSFPIYMTLGVTIVYCYSRIFRTARTLTQRVNPGSADFPQRPSQVESDMKAAKTLAVVVCLNVITWVPALVVLILMAVDGDSNPPSETMLKVSTVTILLPFLHSSWNPWVYALRLPAFRNARKRFHRRVFGQRGRTVGPSANIEIVCL